VIKVNLKGPYFLSQLVAGRMIEQVQNGKASNPKLVTISSVSAYAASMNRGEYCIAKAGLSMMTKLYATRLAEFGINVYEIRPGIIETDMTGPVKAKYDKLISRRTSRRCIDGKAGGCSGRGWGDCDRSIAVQHR